MHDLASLRILSAILVASAAAAGCTTTDEQRLDFTVSGGFGSGVRATASVDLHDGHAILQPLDSPTSPTVETTLAPAELANLRHLVHEANFAALELAYNCSTVGCHSDSVFYKLAVVIDGKTYQVTVEDDASPPPPLRAVIDSLDVLTRPDLPCLVDPTIECPPRAS